MNRQMVLGLLVVLGLVGWRVWGWWSWYEGLQVGSQVSFSQKLWQEPEENWYGLRWKYKGLWVMCDDQVSGCDDLEMYTPGEKLILTCDVADWEVGGKAVGKAVQIRELRNAGASNLIVLLLGNWLHALGDLREEIVEIYQHNLDEPYAGLLAGIVVGEQSVLPDDFYEDLVATGTLHVVAASGYNITVVAGALMTGLVWVIRRKEAVWLALIGVWMYVVLAGMGPAVVRAGLMGSLFFLAQAAGKEYLARWGLGLTIVIFLLIQPWMVRDVSFQLSVFASAGILWGIGPITREFRRVRETVVGVIGNNKTQTTILSPSQKASEEQGKQETTINPQTFEKATGALRGDLSTTLAATLATLPITMIVFERVSLVSPIVNVLVLWLVPPMMALGVLMAGVGLVLAPLAQFIAWLVYPLLWVFVRVVEVFGSLPIASREVVGVNWWVGLAWWLMVFGWWSVKNKKDTINK